MGRGSSRVEQFFESYAIAPPRLVVGMLRADQIPVSQPAHKTLIRLHLHEQVEPCLVIEPGVVHELPGFHHIGCATVQVQG